MAGKLNIIKDKTLRARFENAKTADEVAALADEFVAAIKSNKCVPALFAELEPAQRQQPSWGLRIQYRALEKVLQGVYQEQLAGSARFMPGACVGPDALRHIGGWLV